MSRKPKSNVASYLGFAAWLVYGLLGKQAYWITAACAGFVIMLAIVGYEIVARRIKIIDCTSLGFFLIAIVELATIGEGYFIRYQTIFGWGLFAVAAWVTMIAGVPFRMQYAREKTPRVMWKKPSFQRMHFRVTVAWAVIFTLDTILTAIALGVGHRSLLVVIVPGASMLLGFALTVFYPTYYQREFSTQ
jgi:all-trans-retinol 13,14-reductase